MEVQSIKESDELIEDNKVVVIGFFSSLESDEAKQFNSIAKGTRIKKYLIRYPSG